VKNFTNEHVRCFLRNSTVIEGIVISWAANEIQLQSLDQKSILIIHNPAQDIVLTKVLLSEENLEEISEPEIVKPILPIEENICSLPDDGEEDPMALRAKSVAELKVELAIQERNIIAKKLKDHHFTEVPRKTTYGYPEFFKKKA
jgi:hypothetical protein